MEQLDPKVIIIKTYSIEQGEQVISWFVSKGFVRRAVAVNSVAFIWTDEKHIIYSTHLPSYFDQMTVLDYLTWVSKVGLTDKQGRPNGYILISEAVKQCIYKRIGQTSLFTLVGHIKGVNEPDIAVPEWMFLDHPTLWKPLWENIPDWVALPNTDVIVYMADGGLYYYDCHHRQQYLGIEGLRRLQTLMIDAHAVEVTEFKWQGRTFTNHHLNSVIRLYDQYRAKQKNNEQ